MVSDDWSPSKLVNDIDGTLPPSSQFSVPSDLLHVEPNSVHSSDSMMWKLTAAEPLNEFLSKVSSALIIDELLCRPMSSMLNLISPYCSFEEDVPIVIFPSPPMLTFLDALLESTNVSSIVSSINPKSSKSIVNCP